MRLKFSWSSGTADIDLYDTPTARRLSEVVPFEASANTWGDEVYFDVPMEAVRESDARDVVERGEVCHWLAGPALALLFGPTPVSQGDECRLISDANVLGKVVGDPAVLAAVRSGDTVRVEPAD